MMMPILLPLALSTILLLLLLLLMMMLVMIVMGAMPHMVYSPLPVFQPNYARHRYFYPWYGASPTASTYSPHPPPPATPLLSPSATNSEASASGELHKRQRRRDAHTPTLLAGEARDIAAWRGYHQKVEPKLKPASCRICCCCDALRARDCTHQYHLPTSSP